MMTWENTFLVFDIIKGPKAIIETLDNYGKDGWEFWSMLTEADKQIVACLEKRTDKEEPQGHNGE